MKIYSHKEQSYKKIPGYSTYGATSEGYILNIQTGKFLSGGLTNRGYYRVTLNHLCKHRTFRVNRLIAKAWVDNPENHPYVLHLDNNPQNNHYTNLAWGTQKQNLRQAVREGRIFRRLQPIYQKDLSTGEVIKEWPSPTQAAQALGINSPKNISQAARGIRNSAGGFKWEYK